MRVHPDNSKMKGNFFFVPLCHCLLQCHPLLQPYHFKSHDDGPALQSPPKWQKAVHFRTVFLHLHCPLHSFFQLQHSSQPQAKLSIRVSSYSRIGINIGKAWGQRMQQSHIQVCTLQEQSSCFYYLVAIAVATCWSM